MNIAIISSKTSANTIDLQKAVRAHGYNSTIYQLRDLAFVTHALDDHTFFSHDVYVFRGYNKSYAYAQALAQALQRRGKLVIDAALANGFVPSKFHEALIYADLGIPHIPTYQAGTLEQWRAISEGLQYPLVIKDVDSQKGQGVRLAADVGAAEAEIATHGKALVAQDFMAISYDIRVLCVGDRVIGAMKRRIATGTDDFRTNVSLGGIVSAYELSLEESEIALRAHHALGYDISGVDLIHDANGRVLVIETNITPEWQGFQTATGIDVASAVVAYITERSIKS